MCHAGFVTASPTQTTTYTFYLGSDDGSLLYINNAVVCNDTGEHGCHSESLPCPCSRQASGNRACTIGCDPRTLAAPLFHRVPVQPNPLSVRPRDVQCVTI